jgi:hypothetical protein
MTRFFETARSTLGAQMQRRRFLAGCTIAGTVLLVSPVDSVRAQASSDDRECIESINQALGKVARAENGMLGRCVGA